MSEGTDAARDASVEKPKDAEQPKGEGKPSNRDGDASKTSLPGTDTALARGLHILLLAAAAIVVVAGLKAFSSSIAPVFLALVLVILVRPVQDACDRQGWPKWVGFMALMGSAYGILLAIGICLVWSATQLVSHLSSGSYAEQLGNVQADVGELLAKVGVTGEDLQAALDQLDLGSVAGKVVSAVSGVLGVASLIGLLIMAMLFMTADSSRFIENLEKAVYRDRPDVVDAFRSFASSTRSYFFVSTVFGFIVAVFDVVALLALGVPLAIVWGVLALITNYIPNIGFILGLVPPALLAFLEGGWQLALIVVLAYTGINVIIQSVIQPRFVGDAVGLSATLTFLSLVFWGWVFGPLGALLAVPMSLFVKALLVDIDPSTRWAAPLISLGKPEESSA